MWQPCIQPSECVCLTCTDQTWHHRLLLPFLCFSSLAEFVQNLFHARLKSLTRPIQIFRARTRLKCRSIAIDLVTHLDRNFQILVLKVGNIHFWAGYEEVALLEYGEVAPLFLYLRRMHVRQFLIPGTSVHFLYLSRCPINQQQQPLLSLLISRTNCARRQCLGPTEQTVAADTAAEADDEDDVSLKRLQRARPHHHRLLQSICMYVQ
jgi:hypothetical protein